MMNGENKQPVLVLPEETQRTTGKDALRTNITAARAVAESVKSTLGPRGTDKMLVDSLGDIVVTNDGVTILKEMDVEHPAAKMMVEVAETQDDEVGDGTTTAVVLAGELLKRAEELLDQDVHPTVIAQGYRMAAEKAHDVLRKISVDVSIEDEDMLKKIALTAMSGKGAEKAGEHLAGLVLRAVKSVADEEGGEIKVDVEHIKVEKKEGVGIEDTELIKGIIIDKERMHPSMPRRMENSKIALINSSLEVKKTEADAKIKITDPEQLKAFRDEEENMLREMVGKIKDSGANVIFCQKGVEDLAQHYLAKEGIFAVRRVKKSDIEKLSRATGARIVTNLGDLHKKDLGYAGLVEEVIIGEDKMSFVKDCRNPKSITILIRGGTEHILDEVERAVEDCLGVVPAAIRGKKILAGGGAPEIEIAKKLRGYAKSVHGREQLAIEAFADSIDVIPRILAENAGLDPIDKIVDLRSAHEDLERGWAMGLDTRDGMIKDMFEAGVVEPLTVKNQALNSASEAANMILRIDDVIASKGETPEAPAQGGEAGGMPSMM